LFSKNLLHNCKVALASHDNSYHCLLFFNRSKSKIFPDEDQYFFTVLQDEFLFSTLIQTKTTLQKSNKMISKGDKNFTDFFEHIPQQSI